MKIYVVNKKSKLENIKKKYPSAFILDITSTSEYGGLRMLSPFYPHMDIPIPGMPNGKATCVEAIWQGLKVFEHCGVDYATFQNATMKDIKRTVRKYGKPLGHKYGDKLLTYEDARWMIYLPSYLYVLENIHSVRSILEKIREKLNECDIVFLDYNTNCNIVDYSKPLSHAGLVKLYLEGKYPQLSERKIYEKGSRSTIIFDNIDSLIDAITKHEKFNGKKHFSYIEQIKRMQKVEIEFLINLNGKKRDGWKSIIKEIHDPNRPRQLFLF